MDLDDQLRQGILAAKAGQEDKARQLLLAVVEADDQQLQAWLWLSRLMADLADKEICFENILTLDPNNEYAQKGLAWLKTKRAQAKTQAILTVPLEKEAGSQIDEIARRDEPTVDNRPPDTMSGDIMSHAAAVAAGYVIADEFDNEWLCPYCAMLTDPQDKVCSNCQRTLVVKRRLSPDRSVWLWRGFFLQIYTAFYTLAAGLAYFTFTTKWAGIPNPLIFWPLYFGRPVDQPGDQINLVLATLPRSIFWLLVGAALYSLGLMAILYLRFPFGHLMYLLNAALMFLLGIIGLVISNLTTVQIVAGLGLALGLGQLWITLNLWKDFTFQEVRLRVKLDDGPKTPDALYLSARKYAALKMWGNAVLHLRRAVAARPGNLDYHLALGVGYINLKRYDLAQKSLNDAETLHPHSPQVKTLQQKLASLHDQ